MADELAPERLYRAARERLAHGELRRACELFSEVLRVCPETLDDIAATFGRRPDREQALAGLQPPRSVDGQNVPRSKTDACICVLAARLARDLGRLDQACQWAERAVAAEPAGAAWWFELGQLRMAQSKNREAVGAYRRCLALDPEHALARQALSAAARRRYGRLARLVVRSRLVHRLLRRIAWSPRRLEILEERGDSAGAHQMRWARALELGSALSLFLESPPGQEREKFAEHWSKCDCVFWRWFLDQAIDREVRTVLDVGCGLGFMTEHFLRHGLDVTGVTVNPYEKEECGQRGIKVIEADFHFLPLADESFDLVFSSHSIEHSISPLSALREWKRIVRPRGYLIVFTPLAIDRDIRVAFPKYYNVEDDTMNFTPGEDRLPSDDEVFSSCSTYNMGSHVFVFSYWQLRWLFQLMGLELIAQATEDPIANEILGTEYVDGRLPRDPKRAFSGMFLLRKPDGSSATPVASN